jgi:hypothetical protein
MRCLTILFVAILCLGPADRLLGAWDDDLIYRGGTIDYILARPDTGEVRVFGGGLPEWKQFFKAGGFSNGANGIPENGGGDDVFLGVLHASDGLSWSTSVPQNVGRIKPNSGAFRSGPDTGEGTVTATFPGVSPVNLVVRVYPPDWQPGNQMIDGDGNGEDGEQAVETATMGGVPTPEPDRVQIRNYPNPFNPSTTFSYRIPAGEARSVNLEVYTLRGQRVASLVDAVQSPGDYQVQWDGTDARGVKVSSGVYLYRLRVDGASVVRKMTIAK